MTETQADNTADSEFAYPGEYECDCCGACCAGHLMVEADAIDVVREPEILKAVRLPVQLTIRKLWENDGQAILLAAGPDRPCPFLTPVGRDSNERLCTIYSTRPNGCVSFQAGDMRCQDARKRAGLKPLKRVSEAR